MNTANTLTVSNLNPYQPVVRIVVNGLDSPKSKTAYEKSITQFLTWCDREHRAFNKATAQRYRVQLETRGLAPASINQQLSAIRKLAAEAADNGLLDASIANGIARVKGVKQAGVRSGNWLTKEQAQALLDAPNVSIVKGLRDRAILAVMLGAGLRRSEVAALTFEHIQQRDARWMIVDIVGKGNRVRSVPIPSWTKAALDEWARAATLATGFVFRSIHKGGMLAGETMSAQAVHDVVKEYGAALGVPLAAHDLRRTFAKLAHKGGAGLDQIQLSLGHASIKTTERYLGVQQNLHDAPCDRLGLNIGA